MLIEIFTIFWFCVVLFITLYSICDIVKCIFENIKEIIKNRRNCKIKNERCFYSQSDWNESDIESNSYIGKKPTIPPIISSYLLNPTRYITADELNVNINVDLCCKNCLYRKENGLYCYKINREINLNQCCQYLVYRLRFDIPERCGTE